MSTYQQVPGRRSSIVGPLLLLVLGGVFLLHNLRPEFSLSRLAQYWPYLLIFWGAARLVEYLAARAAGRPIAQTLTGGEVALAVLICVAGSGYTSFSRASFGFRLPDRGFEVFGESYQFEVRAEHTVPPKAAVLIQNLRGDVRVTGVAGDRLTVTAKKTVRALSRSDAETADRETSLEISEQDGRVVVRTNQDRARDNRRVSADLEISIPRSSALTLEGRDGDLDLQGAGGVRIAYARANQIRAAEVHGGVEIDGRGRDISLDGVEGAVGINGTFSGDVRLKKVSGAVRFTSPQTTLSLEKLPGSLEMEPGSLVVTGVVGPFRLDARRKDVRVEGFTNELEARLRQGDLELRPEKGNSLGAIRADTARGDIRLAVPAGARFVLEGNAAHGNVVNDLGVAISIDRRGQATQARGGAGGPSIRLATERGDIVLRRAD